MSEQFRQATRNAVLVRDDVGKAKPTVYDLPPDGHAYGRSDPPDAEGARDVTMCWAAHVPRARPNAQCQDYVRLNSKAAMEGVTNAGALREFKRHNDIRLNLKAAEGPGPCVIPSDVLPAFAYGNKSRPSTPIHRVVSNGYGNEQELLLRHMYQTKQGGSGGKRTVRLTVASKRQIAHARSARQLVESPPEQVPEWKMSKFKNVAGKMSAEQMGRSASAPRLTTLMG